MDRTEGANFIEIDNKRRFTDGPPATTIGADFLNAVQEEIVGAIEASGQIPSAGDTLQLYKAMQHVVGYPWIDPSGYASLADADAAAVVAGKPLLIAQNYTLTANTTFTAAVIILKGGSFTKAAAFTLTFNGPTSIGRHTVFYGFSAGDVTGLKEVRPQWFGSVDGVSNTTAIQCAFDSVSNNATVRFDGMRFVFTEATLSKKYVSVVGDGIIDGTIKVMAPASDITNNTLDMHITFTATFNNVSARASAAAIKLNNSRRGMIRGCRFIGFEKAVSIPTNADPTAWGGHVARWIIDHNTYENCDYFIHGVDSYSHGASLSTADMGIDTNEGTANIVHVDIDSIDGVTVTNNMFFFSSYLLESAVKAQNIKLQYVVWGEICGNKCFEAGTEGIYLNLVSRTQVHDNYIAWPGQRVESAAIKVVGSPIAGNYYGFLDIHDNNIVEPTGHGIDVGAKQGKGKIHDNLIWYPGRADRYYGVPALSGTQKTIKTDSDTISLITHNNYGTHKAYDLSGGGANQTNIDHHNVTDLQGDGGSTNSYSTLNVKTLAATETTLAVDTYDQVNFEQSGATNFATFTHTIGTNKIKAITTRFYNGNTTLVHGTYLYLKGGINVTPVANNFMEFQVTYDGSNSYAIEVSRSF